jgi:hypothetical protein
MGIGGKMRACFLGQNLFALGFGVATLQAPALVNDQPGRPPTSKASKAVPERKKARRPNWLEPGNKSAT